VAPKRTKGHYQLDLLTRTEFSALAGGLRVDGCIVFDHGPDRAAIHHEIKDKSARYTLSLYPVFDSIRITRLGPEGVVRTA
jgi:hypothetical protein